MLIILWASPVAQMLKHLCLQCWTPEFDINKEYSMSAQWKSDVEHCRQWDPMMMMV